MNCEPVERWRRDLTTQRRIEEDFAIPGGGENFRITFQPHCKDAGSVLDKIVEITGNLAKETSERFGWNLWTRQRFSRLACD